MSKVFEYFEERKKMGIVEYRSPRQRNINEADYDDLRYKEKVDKEAVERAKR